MAFNQIHIETISKKKNRKKTKRIHQSMQYFSESDENDHDFIEFHLLYHSQKNCNIWF